MPTLTTLISFNGTDGSKLFADLIVNAAGDLFGTAYGGGAYNGGTAFEIAKTSGGYASTPTILANFTSTSGSAPYAGLIADAAGDLFGTAKWGGVNGNYGAVFEIPKAASGYGTLIILATFNGTNGDGPAASLITDAAGDLFGTTSEGGANGSVFEIVKTAGGYASTPTTLVTFNSTDGTDLQAGLIADAAGDLFGTAEQGGASGYGTVFEIAKTTGGYASTPTILVSFSSTGAEGEYPQAGLIADAAGDLFGTAESTVFEIPKTTSGYRTLITLVTFNGTDGTSSMAGLIADAAGDLFGTTAYGGAHGDGTVFEIAKTSDGYASTPTTLFSFNGTNGEYPYASLIADATGNLFGTTYEGGADGDGTVFELSGSGFVVPGITLPLTISGAAANQAVTDPGSITPFSGVTITDANSAQPEAVIVTLSAAVNGTLSNLDGGSYNASTGVYTDTGTTAAVTAALDGLVFTPTANLVSLGQTFTTTFTITDTDTAGKSATDSTTTVVATAMPTVTTLVSFNDIDGPSPSSILIGDTAGDLFGTTYEGGTFHQGSVFEIAKTGGSYADTPTTLASFSDSDAFAAVAGVITDAAGDLFATTANGGANNEGSVFELVNNGGGGYTLTTLASFASSSGYQPDAGVIADAAGNLLGTTWYGGANGDGTVFEVAKIGTGYATTPITLASLNGVGGLMTDAAGNLFGTTTFDGANGDGTVFEIPYVDGSYASTPTILADFNGTNGADPNSNLVADAAGDLFGTTPFGGTLGSANSNGVVFEISKTSSGYGTPVALASFGFRPADGSINGAVLIVDAAGDLFGTTAWGGANGDGTVFEIAKTAGGYASSMTTLFTFNGSNGYEPTGLTADAAGNLFVTTSLGGATGGGAVFELSGTGFVVANTVTPTISGTVADQMDTELGAITPFSKVTIADANVGQTETVKVTLSVAANGTLSNLGGGSYNATTGVYTVGGTAAKVSSALDALVFNPAGGAATTRFTINVTDTAGTSATDGTTSVITRKAGLTALVSFNGTNGSSPCAGLIADAAGDLFGTTEGGGANGDGTVFEIVKTGTSYASTSITLLSFNGTNGSDPCASLIADAAGNLFGTTGGGGTFHQGSVFEIAKTSGGYASTPTTLASFNGTNGSYLIGSLITDAAGDLFGTAQNGVAFGDGTVFEIAKTGGGYASTPTVLVNFNGTNGEMPNGSLITDAAGDLFGTTAFGGANSDGTVFEIPYINGSYASTPTILVSFNGTNGAIPVSGLIADAAGDLFGTTEDAGSNGVGTVFEIPCTDGSYGTPIILVSFITSNGDMPAGGLTIDAAGNLFGTTQADGANAGGTVFEIAKTAGGYASAPTILASLGGTNGEYSRAGLIADTTGDLFGTTTEGGVGGDGTVFEVSDTGFVASTATPPVVTLALSPAAANGRPAILGTAAPGTNSDALSVTLTSDADFATGSTLVLNNGTLVYTPGTITAALAGTDTIRYTVTDTVTGAVTTETENVTLIAPATNDFTGSGVSDILWRNAPTGTVAEWVMNGGTVSSSVTLLSDPAWAVVGTGDFMGNGTSDILWRNASTGAVAEWVMSNGTLASSNQLLTSTAWAVAGTGDFTGNGTDDILWRNAATGAVAEWVMNNGTLASSVGLLADPAWNVAGVGDFMGNGTDDILWRNASTGAVVEWVMNNGTEASSIGLRTDPTWNVVGTGDFAGIGTDDILWRQASTGTLVEWVMNNGTEAASVTLLTNPVMTVAGTGDYTGNGIDDILLNNATTGATSEWLINNGTLASAGTLLTSTAWNVVPAAPAQPMPPPSHPVADFNGDGTSDILWSNAGTGTVAEWLMNAGTAESSSTLLTSPSWTVAGSGDFTGNGTSDILWNNATTGQTVEWQMSNGSLAASGQLLDSTAWTVVGTGDFYGTGGDDILWRDAATGTVAAWEMNGFATINSETLLNDPSWTVAGVGDFYGNGTDDILWRQASTGTVADWQMNGGAMVGGTQLLSDPSWTVAGIGDFWGTGTDDILWRQASTGTVALWQMNNGAMVGSTTLLVDPSWAVVGVGDYNGDGKSDILWQNTGTGQTAEWLMNGSTVSSSIGLLSSTAWTPAASLLHSG